MFSTLVQYLKANSGCALASTDSSFLQSGRWASVNSAISFRCLWARSTASTSRIDPRHYLFMVLNCLCFVNSSSASVAIPLCRYAFPR
jgi:hypothetical protein